MTTHTLNVIADPDNPEELLLDLGEDLCAQLGWNVGDEVSWTAKDDGSWVLAKVVANKPLDQ